MKRSDAAAKVGAFFGKMVPADARRRRHIGESAVIGGGDFAGRR